VQEVTLHWRFPQMQVAVAPSNAITRRHAGMLLDRVLQTATTGKSLEFLGLCADGKLGGDGTVVEERGALLRDGGDGEVNLGGVIEAAASARNAMMIAAQTHKQLKQTKGGGGPGSAAGALTCTLNSTNQILHLCILVALFGGDGKKNGPDDAEDNDDGTISWNPRKDLTPLPRYARQVNELRALS